jgi:hypothetical protein
LERSVSQGKIQLRPIWDLEPLVTLQEVTTLLSNLGILRDVAKQIAHSENLTLPQLNFSVHIDIIICATAYWLLEKKVPRNY